MTDLFNAWGNYEPRNSVSASLTSFGYGAVAQSVERSSKVPVWCNSTDMGSKHVVAKESGKKILAAPSGFGDKYAV